MFVIIADHNDSDPTDIRVSAALEALSERFITTYLLAPERTAGNQLQAVTDDSGTALDTALHLLRAAHWRVGLGIGAMSMPLPDSISAASGPAVIAARSALERAARRSTRFAAVGAGAAAGRVEQAGALIDLLLVQRARWSAPGWQLHELIESGLSQSEAAARLGITPQATSKRARAAGLRVDANARRALASVLMAADTFD